MKSIRSILAGREAVTVRRATSIIDASRIMADHQISALPIVEEDGLLGIFTERDLLVRIVVAGRDPAATSIGDVMSTQLQTADIEEPYEACLRRMQEARVRHLIILDKNRLAGILSVRDLMAVDLDEKADAINLLNAYVRT